MSSAVPKIDSSSAGRIANVNNIMLFYAANRLKIQFYDFHGFMSSESPASAISPLSPLFYFLLYSLENKRKRTRM